MLEVLIGALLAVPISAAIKSMLLSHRNRRERLYFHRAQFFDIAQKMTQDDALDQEALARIDKMTSDMDDPALFRRLRRAVSELEQETAATGPYPCSAVRLHPDWAALCYNYVLALSYKRPFQGFLVRSRLAHLLDPRTSARTTDIIDQRIHALQAG
jgi:hypothetical protein